MIKSVSPGIKKTYVGYTNNILARLEKHNSNKGAKSTKGYKW
jgi:putative endonuclease